MHPLLLTPGPLTTAEATRQAMLGDFGSRDPEFIRLVARVRQAVTALMAPEGYTTIPVQGSGTFAVEAMVGTLVPPHGKVLVLVNGAYGRRIRQIAACLGRRAVALEGPEDLPVDPGALDAALRADQEVTHVAVVHCETTTGLLNPVREVAEVVARHGRRLLIDAMSAFGAIPLSARDVPCDAVAASANKCLEGVPGLGLVVARVDAIAVAAGQAHSVSLDLHDQWQRLEQDGQFRFTPPTHVLSALGAALDQHAEEGGVEGRGARYRANHRALVAGMRSLGFATLLPDRLQAPIIVTFHDPGHPSWDFRAFYAALVARGFAIYPGKLTRAATFRVGCIGQVFKSDIQRFLVAVEDAMTELGIPSGAPAPPMRGDA